MLLDRKDIEKIQEAIRRMLKRLRERDDTRSCDNAQSGDAKPAGGSGQSGVRDDQE